MNAPLVVNASPLIVLGKAGLLEILPKLASSVRTTRAVMDEVAAKPSDVKVVEAVRTAQWLDVIERAEVPATVLAWDLGAGESSVLAAGLQSAGSEVVLDDLAARRAAAAFGLPVVGTLGLLVRAERMSVILSALAAVDRVIAAGLHVSPRLLEQLRAELSD